MAVFDPGLPNLSSSYAQIQDALNKRANLELNRPQALDIATAGVQRFDQETALARKFAKEMEKDGRVLVTDEGIDKFIDSTGLQDEPSKEKIRARFQPLKGQWYKPETLAELNVQAQAQEHLRWYEDTIKNDPSLTDAQRAAAVTPEGRREITQKLFQADKAGKPIKIADKNSSTGYYHGVMGPDGQITKTQFEAPPDAQSKVGGAKVPEGEKAVDRAFAKTYEQYVASGGSADVAKQIDQLKEVRKELENNPNATGRTIGLIPPDQLDRVAPKAAALKQRVEDVVQRNLRLILGAQFTQVEGERLIARAYNINQPVAENEKRLDSLIKQMEGAAKAKEAAISYFEENGTLKGFKGKIYSSADDFLTENKASKPKGKILSVEKVK